MKYSWHLNKIEKCPLIVMIKGHVSYFIQLSEVFHYVAYLRVETWAVEIFSCARVTLTSDSVKHCYQGAILDKNSFIQLLTTIFVFF